VSFAPGFARAEPPVGWGRADRGWLCLGCRRQHAVDEAAAEGQGSVAEVRRRALTEFELQRDPSAPDHVIAKRVKCATSYVLPVRAELRDAGVLPAP
jgi:hypothetical protein